MALALAACVLAVRLQTPAPTSPPLRLRFHHVHVRVADPASASRDASARLNGTRTILQGHGIAVRAQQQYVVFDRDDGTASPDPADAFHQAVRWVNEHGMDVEPREFASVGVRDAIQSRRTDVMAFATAEPAVAIEWLVRRGIQPTERRDDVARFELSKGLTLEIMGETDRPETYWCPMHPDIRSASAVKCSLCAMELVPIPPPKIGEYRLDVAAIPGASGRGISGLRLRIRDPETFAPVTSFLDVHERRLHLFIVSRNLEYFAHVHPEQGSDGSFAIDHELPEGEYMLIGDFLPAGGTSQMVQRAIVTPHYKGQLFGGSVLELTDREQVVDGLRVRLETDSVRPLRPSSLRFVIADASTGKPVTDLEPYLGAPGHLLIIDPDMKSAIHGHPDTQTSGPEVAFDPVLPSAGRYKLWLQVQRKGRVVTVPFVIEVPAS
jgi:hypothetical protein